MKQEKIHLKDYLAPDFSVESIDLNFDLHEDKSLVTATSKMIKTNPSAPLVLDGEALKLISVKLDGRLLSASEYEVTTHHLRIPQAPSTFTLEVVTELEPQNNTSLCGLYKSQGIFATQCEAQDFRRITYFFDRPDVMTIYTVTIEADKTKYPVLLSNGDRIKLVDLENGRHKAYWKDPHKKPCYLFALVAGDLGVIKDTFTTASGKKVNLEIYAAHGRQDRCHFAMESLKKSMKWDEDTYGLEYDLNDYMIVAIDDFNAGAMENKGLNIFNSRLVLADTQTATDDEFQAIDAVVAHEYFHNWTGNRVTLRDWFQLSLKEGLTVFRDQEYSADMTDRGVQRISDVDSLRTGQFAEDAGPNAHPVRPESCLSVDNFFTMTIYEKGAELIRMMQTIVGRKGFRKGMDLYFKRHDGQAVTTEDFAAAIADANNKDFTQLKRWYSQAGTPIVKVLEKYDSATKEYTLTLSQTCPPTPGQSEKQPFHIPLIIGLLGADGKDLELSCKKLHVNTDGQTLIELKEETETFVFKNISEKPVLSLGREFSAPIKLQWEASDADLYFLMENDSDSFNRREAGQKVMLQTLKTLIGKTQQGQPLEVSAEFLRAIGAIIKNKKLDAAFKANMLQIPPYSILAQEFEIIDAPAFTAAKNYLRKTIAVHFENELTEVYNSEKGDTAKSRELRNMALHLLASLETSQASLVKGHYQKAQNMTDKMGALKAIAHGEWSFKEETLEDFYQQWKHDGLVINKWFTVQASSTQKSTLNKVKDLCLHPSFNINNPNNVYSLLRNFGNNISVFHHPELNAYEFYADKIIEIDAKNPHVAARLCAAFNFVKKLNPEMKAKALTQIQRILQVENLSPNTRELLQSAI